MTIGNEPAPGWRLDELIFAGRENLDPGHVQRYDAKMDAGAPQDAELLRTLGLDTESVVVDFGAGTGQFVRAVSPHCARVVAVDVSPAMIDFLRSQVTADGLDNVEVVAAGFLTYQHQGDLADFVYTRYALHHLPDFWKSVALTRLRAVLRPGGVLRLADVVYNFVPHEAEQRLEAWCATGGEDSEGDWSRGELEEHVRDEHSTYTWLLEPMIERSGFVIEEAAYSEEGFDAQYILRAH